MATSLRRFPSAAKYAASTSLVTYFPENVEDSNVLTGVDDGGTDVGVDDGGTDVGESASHSDDECDDADCERIAAMTEIDYERV